MKSNSQREKKLKGIVLAGGSGTRLLPVTLGTSKQLLPIYDKPMIYYPISVLMLAGIKDILIITTREDQAAFTRLLGDGSNYGVNFNYEVQDKPKGIAEAFIIGKNFIKNENVSLILGDNIFWGQGFTETLSKLTKSIDGAKIISYKVLDPRNFGVVEFNESQKVISIEEKPIQPKSKYAITGLYFYDNEVVSIAKGIKPSKRGELEITSINQEYLNQDKLSNYTLGRGFTWLDTGTHNNLIEATRFVEAIENRQGYKIGCLEEIAFQKGWISTENLLERIRLMKDSNYGRYLSTIIDE